MPYSPSQTELFARCPLKWWLMRRQGFEVKYIAKNDLARWMGNAVHAGASTYYMGHRTPKVEHIRDVMMEEWKTLIDEAIAQGRVIDDEEMKLEIEGKLRNVAPKLIIEQDPFPLSWSIDHVEGILEDNSRIDIGGRDNNRIPFYADFKSTLYCKESDIPSRLGDYAFSHQMLHYAHFYSRAVGEHVRRYFIPYTILAPKAMIHMAPYEVDEQQLARWYVSAQQWWGQMDMWLKLAEEKGDAWVTDHIAQSPNHKDGWGRCPMYDACVNYGLEPELMRTQYVQIEKGAPIVSN